LQTSLRTLVVGVYHQNVCYFVLLSKRADINLHYVALVITIRVYGITEWFS